MFFSGELLVGFYRRVVPYYCQHLLVLLITCLAFLPLQSRALSVADKPAAGNIPLTLNFAESEIPLGKSLWFFEDKRGDLTFEDILLKEKKGKFIRNTSEVFKRGITNSSFWFKLSIAGPAVQHQDWLFDVNFPWLSQLEMYSLDDSGEYTLHKTGYSEVFGSRQIRSTGFVFPISLQPNKTAHFYFKVVADGQTLFPLKAVTTDRYIAKKVVYNIAMAVFYGVLIAMLIYNIFVFIALKSKSYFLYVAFIFTLICMSFVVDGYGYMFIWPDQPQFNIYMSYLLPLVVALLMLSVTVDFLALDSSKGKRVYSMVSWLVVIAMPTIFFLPNVGAAALVAAISAIVLLLIVYASIKRVQEGHDAAKYFLTAWICLLVGSFAKVGTIMGFLPHNIIMYHAVHIGATLQVLLLAFALGNRISVLQSERSKLKSRVIDEANKNSRLKNDFLTLISHELRTPMNGVDGALQLMKTRELDDEMREYIETASHSAADMMLLIDSILSFSEAQSGNLALNEQAFSLRQLLKPINSRYTRRCNRKNLLFNCQVSSAVPKYLVGDVKKISEVIDKLLDNAVKFTEQGTVSMSVAMQSNQLDDDSETGHVALVFQIVDTGQGVRESEKDTIFDSFSQQERPFTRQHGGLGIGLAMCKQLARLMGGELSFDSEYGVGSQFQFMLSLKRASVEQIRKLASDIKRPIVDKPREKAVQQKTRATRVLVVEDNNVNQRVLSGMLQKLGCEVLTANNGVEALEVLNKKLIDVVLMDCQMPVMDGFETTRLIRKTNFANKKVPIIAVTANTMTEDEKSCRSAGMDDYMKKPVKKAIVEEKLAHWLNVDSTVTS